MANRLRSGARAAASSLFLICGWTCALADATTPAIPGVLREGTPVQLVAEGFETVEGPLPQADGGLLFTNNRLSRILRLAPDGSISTYFEGKGSPNALTYTPSGEIAATLHDAPAIGLVKPGESPRPLVAGLEGKPFSRPNDLVADRRGNIYFSDAASPTATSTPALPSSVYWLAPQGQLTVVDTAIARPNGVALGPDDRTLYVANTAGEWIYAYALDRKGKPGKRREFAKLAMPEAATGTATTPTPVSSGADGIAVDAKGRVFVATTLGVQVFSAKGKALGTIVLPKQPQNLAFSGSGHNDLYVVGRGAVYRIATLTRGPRRTGK